MKVNRLLAGTLALVLIAGLGTSAFAVSSILGADEIPIAEIATEPNRPLTDEENVIFDGGTSDFDVVCGTVPPDTRCAEDFVLEEDSIVTDVHFDALDLLGPDVIPEIEYFFYADDGGVPGVLIQSGFGVNVHKEAIDDINFRYWFDLDNPLSLAADTTFWISLGGELDIDFVDWWTTSPGFGNVVAATSDDGEIWDSFPPFQMNFVLTGHPPDDVVGGELLPIDNTALMLAGLQSSAIWMLPVLAGAAGIGAYYIKTRMNKE